MILLLTTTDILFTKELQRRLEGTNVFTYAVHPGTVNTEITKYCVHSVSFHSKITGT
jgi:NAD(P)-dependent dehydrogenase (short-subunit alcohol dehydrogenase family)